VQNALKFSAGGGAVEVSAVEKSGCFEISVSDEGVGMAPEKLEKLFAKYKNESSLGTRGEKGAGVGLSICSDLMEKCGGKISAESALGKGSVFTVTVPKLG
jgi:signal transduction histidine kinase